MTDETVKMSELRNDPEYQQFKLHITALPTSDDEGRFGALADALHQNNNETLLACRDRVLAMYEPGPLATKMHLLDLDDRHRLYRSMQNDYVYLASPYSHPDPVMMVARYEAVTREAGRLMVDGWNIFAPIAHSHVVAERTELPKTWEYWKQVDKVFLRQAGALFVYMIDGWDRSIGVLAEIEMAKQMGKPTYYMFPGAGLAVLEYD